MEGGTGDNSGGGGGGDRTVVKAIAEGSRSSKIVGREKEVAS